MKRKVKVKSFRTVIDVFGHDHDPLSSIPLLEGDRGHQSGVPSNSDQFISLKHKLITYKQIQYLGQSPVAIVY